MVVVMVAFSCVYSTRVSKIEESNRLLWVFVQMPNCPWYIKMDEHIIKSGFYKRRLASMYALEVLSKEEARDCGFKTEFYPTSYLIKPNANKILDELSSYLRPADFLEFLTIVYEQSGLGEQSP